MVGCVIFLSINSLNSAERAFSPEGQGGDAVTQVMKGQGGCRGCLALQGEWESLPLRISGQGPLSLQNVVGAE